MNEFDKLLVGLIVLALVAVLVASKRTSGAVGAIGSTIKQLASNIVGTGKQNG